MRRLSQKHGTDQAGYAAGWPGVPDAGASHPFRQAFDLSPLLWVYHLLDSGSVGVVVTKAVTPTCDRR